MNVERMWNDRSNPVLLGEGPTTSRLSQETTRKRWHECGAMVQWRFSG